MNVSSEETRSVLKICISSHYLLMEESRTRLYLHLFFYFKEAWLDHKGGGGRQGHQLLPAASIVWGTKSMRGAWEICQ